MRLSVRQLSQELGLSESAVRGHIRKFNHGLHLPEGLSSLYSQLSKVGCRWFIDQRDVRNWLSSRRAKVRRVNLPGTPIAELEARACQLATEARVAGCALAADLFEFGRRALG